MKNIDKVEVVSLIGRTRAATQKTAQKYGIGHVTEDLAKSLARDDVDAVILCTPTALHAAQAIACLEAGKHVQVEIPLADSLADAEAVLAKQQETGLTCIVGHTRRFNPSHQLLNRKIVAAHAIEGPIHPELGIAMDMSIPLKSESGAICTLSLSFNNAGPLGTFFRYICDNGNWLVRYDDLFTGNEEVIDVSTVDVSMNGIELQDREFIPAIRDGREPNSSVAQVLPCYRIPGALEAQLMG